MLEKKTASTRSGEIKKDESALCREDADNAFSLVVCMDCDTMQIEAVAKAKDWIVYGCICMCEKCISRYR